jgi:hypothetical protein
MRSIVDLPHEPVPVPREVHRTCPGPFVLQLVTDVRVIAQGIDPPVRFLMRDAVGGPQPPNVRVRNLGER